MRKATALKQEYVAIVRLRCNSDATSWKVLASELLYKQEGWLP